MREGLDRVVMVRYDEERGTSVVRQQDVGDTADESGDLPGASGGDDTTYEMLEAGD